MITPAQLAEIYPQAPKEKLFLYADAFKNELPKYDINTPKRLAAFLGQIGVESGQLKYDKELPSKWNMKNPQDPNEKVGTLYEGRKNLGNVQEGDGVKFIGRGLIQLTGRSNYFRYGKDIGADLVGNPELAKEPKWATAIAGQYWKSNGCNELADAWNLLGITKRVNGAAALHHDIRAAISERALSILEGKGNA